MPELAESKVGALSRHLREHIVIYRTRQSWHHNFAFWHDVGVTGLGALATALLGLTEISRQVLYQNVIRGSVLFITAAITIFVACDHFFRFKAREEAYRSALAQLLSIERRMGLAVNPSPEEVTGLGAEFEAAVSKVDPEPVGSIWFSGRRKWFLASIIVAVGGLLFVLIYYAAVGGASPSPKGGRSHAPFTTSLASATAEGDCQGCVPMLGRGPRAPGVKATLARGLVEAALADG
jgi:hypothetical protein